MKRVVFIVEPKRPIELTEEKFNEINSKIIELDNNFFTICKNGYIENVQNSSERFTLLPLKLSKGKLKFFLVLNLEDQYNLNLRFVEFHQNNNFFYGSMFHGLITNKLGGIFWNTEIDQLLGQVGIQRPIYYNSAIMAFNEEDLFNE